MPLEFYHNARSSLLLLGRNPNCAVAFLVCLLGLSATLMADDEQTTLWVGKRSVVLPEIKLAKKVNPVTTFLYLGSWKGGPNGKSAQTPLGVIDSENSQLNILSSEKLLDGSRPRLVTQNGLDAFLDEISWDRQQATHFAFKVMSDRQQSVVVEANANSDVVLFHNGKPASNVMADAVFSSQGRACIPVMLEVGENIINIKQFSSWGKPRIQVAVYLDHSRDLTAAWQSHGGFLRKLLYMPRERNETAMLDWSPALGNFSMTFEVRDVSANKIIYQNESMSRGRRIDDEITNLAPGVYEAVYHGQGESVSESFVVGNPNDLLAGLRDRLVKYNVDAESKLNIEAQLRRARILLAENSYDTFDKKWQEKMAYTLGSLFTIERRLKEGVSSIAKNQSGLHIRGFASGIDGSAQFYRLFVPSSYKQEVPLPLLVIMPVRIVARERAFIESPIMANHRSALLWAQYAEKYGFALLWPGYRSAPEGRTYESVHVDEAIQAVEKDYAIDRHRISLHGFCGAGFNAGRLVSEYSNRFAAIVYDQAVFDRLTDNIQDTPSLMTWYETINPSRYVIENRNLKIFVMHDDTERPGHGEMSLTTQFLGQARKTRNDIGQCLGQLPIGITRMDMVFSWLAPCRNENPNGTRSRFLAKAGYIGPISEIFATPFIVVEGTRGTALGVKNMHDVAKSLSASYKKYFHDAEYLVKNDIEMTEDDINTHSLVLIGNPESNSVWGKLQPHIPLKITTSKILRGGEALGDDNAFIAIERHPYAAGKYVLLMGAGNLRYLRRLTTANPYNAWYDYISFSSPAKIIGKLDPLQSTQKSQE